jgi:hypothetical protein
MGYANPPAFIAHNLEGGFDTETLDRRTANCVPPSLLNTSLQNQLMNRTHIGIGAESFSEIKLDSTHASYWKGI